MQVIIIALCTIDPDDLIIYAYDLIIYVYDLIIYAYDLIIFDIAHVNNFHSTEWLKRIG